MSRKNDKIRIADLETENEILKRKAKRYREALDEAEQELARRPVRTIPYPVDPWPYRPYGPSWGKVDWVYRPDNQITWCSNTTSGRTTAGLLTE
jgi:hypothetical protein